MSDVCVICKKCRISFEGYIMECGHYMHICCHNNYINNNMKNMENTNNENDATKIEYIFKTVIDKIQKIQKPKVTCICPCGTKLEIAYECTVLDYTTEMTKKDIYQIITNKLS